MSYDPVAQMGLDEKRVVVEADQVRVDARDRLEKAMRDRVPELYQGGKVLPLVFYPNKLLTQPCKRVEDFGMGSGLGELVTDMATTMYLLGGVGLAAPQVGVNLRLLVCDWGEKRGQLQVMINPEVVATGADLISMPEACLSIPVGKIMIERPKVVTVRFQDLKGKTHDMPLTEWPARIALHEIDHLDGKLMLDLAGRVDRRLAIKKLEKHARLSKPKKPPKRRRY